MKEKPNLPTKYNGVCAKVIFGEFVVDLSSHLKIPSSPQVYLTYK